MMFPLGANNLFRQVAELRLRRVNGVLLVPSPSARVINKGIANTGVVRVGNWSLRVIAR